MINLKSSHFSTIDIPTFYITFLLLLLNASKFTIDSKIVMHTSRVTITRKYGRHVGIASIVKVNILGGSPGLVLLEETHDPEVVGSNPGTVY